MHVTAWVDGEMQPVEKLEAHRRGLRHKAISVFLIHGDDLLIQRRALGKYHTPGLWANTCCSHPDWGESSERCAARRLWEELGIEDVPLSHVSQIEYRAAVGDGLTEHELVDVFLSRVESRPRMKLNVDEVMDVSWVSVEALPEMVMNTPEVYTPWLRIYLERGLLATMRNSHSQVE